MQITSPQPEKAGWVQQIGRAILGRKSHPAAAGNNSAMSRLSKDDQRIIMQIIAEFKDSSRKLMKDWRQALDACNDINTPRWSALQDLYDYLEPDAQLGTSKDIRAAATLGRPYMIYSKKTQTEQPEKTELLKNKEWFFNFMWHFLDSILKGITVAQLADPVTMTFDYIPRRNIIPQKDFVLFEVSGETGVSYKDPAFQNSVISVKYKHQYGIINDIVPNLIWKKNARQAWAEFAEKFGIPPIWATTNKSDKKTLDRLEAMLKALGEAASAVLPEGTTVTVQDQATKGDPHKVYLAQIELDDQQIAKRLLGGTMITDAGSSRSQSEVHERTLKEVISLFDRMLVLFVVNDYLLPLMARHGYPFTEDDAFKFDDSEDLTLTELWTIVKGMLESGLEIDPEWIAKTFNVPVSGFKEPATQSFNTPSSSVQASALEGAGILLPDYRSRCGHHHTGPAADSFSSRLLEELSEVLLNELWQGKDTLTTEVLKSIETQRVLLDALYTGWSNRMELNYSAVDHHCLAMMEYNLFQFSRVKERSFVLTLNQLLHDKEKLNIHSFADFEAAAKPYLDKYDRNHLRTEYNHTKAVGQNSSRYFQFTREADTVTRYVQYQTAGDSHVRPKHQAMDGMIVSLDDQKARLIWPPDDWGCRCEMIQYLGKPPKHLLVPGERALSILGMKEGDKWAINRGDLQQVFTQNEKYMKDLGYDEDLNKMAYSKYGLKAYRDIKGEYPTLKLDKSITGENVSELWKPVKGETFTGYQDYYGRNLIMNQDVFEEHTTKEKYIKQGRHQLFPHVADVLKDPDEVYLFEYKAGKFQTRYVKFYNNDAIVVNAGVGSNNVEVNTWYSMDNRDDINRKGYLIHKKQKQ